MNDTSISFFLLIFFIYIKKVLAKGQQKYIKKFRLSPDPIKRTVIDSKDSNLTDYLHEKKILILYAKQKKNMRTSRSTLRVIIIAICGKKIDKAKRSCDDNNKI